MWRYEGRLKTVTSLVNVLQKDRRGDKLDRLSKLSFWRMRKGVHRDGLVDKDKTSVVLQ